MTDKLKDALTDIRDEMVNEDLKRELSTEKLSQTAEKKILNTNKKGKFDIKGIFNKKLIAIAASILVVIAAYITLPYVLSSKSTNIDMKKADNNVDMRYDSKDAAPTESAPDSKEAAKSEEASVGADSYVYPTNQKDDSQKIVYRFFYDVQTLDFKKTEAKLKSVISQTNSYIANADIFMKGELMSGEFLIRVPKENSNKFQESIAGLGTIISQSVSSDDLTKEYRDLEADKLTQDIKEKKLQELLKGAKNFEDIIKIQGELSEIESRKIQLQNQISEIDHDVDYQYFSVSLREVKKAEDPVGKKVTFFDKLRTQFEQSIIDVINFFEGLILFIIRNWIIILILALAAVFGYKKYKKSRL